MKKFSFILLSIIALCTGCASNPMMVSAIHQIEPPETDQAQVIFMRDTFVGSAINASLYDVSGDQPEFIGIIANGTKVSYTTSPGPHTFMVVSEAADFMEAELAPGKTYYSLVTPRMGAWKARFSLWPIKSEVNAEYQLDSDEFAKWQRNTKVADITDKALGWYRSNKPSVMAKQAKYWPVWQTKSEADIAKRTLTPEDGI